MNWALILAFVTKLLADLPAIIALIQDLFGKATPAGNPETLSSPEAVSNLFRALRDQTWIWQFGKRAKLTVAERIAKRHAPALSTFATTRQAPALSHEDFTALMAA